MPNTYFLIASNTVGSGGVSSITFSSIPSTYTDLLVKVSARGTDTSTNGWNQGGITFNSSSTGYASSNGVGRGDLSQAAFTGSATEIGYAFYMSNSVTSANTFAIADIYIPNYTSSNYKSVSSDFVEENNNVRALLGVGAGLWANTSAITSLTLTPSTGTLVQDSTAYLYGITKS